MFNSVLNARIPKSIDTAINYVLKKNMITFDNITTTSMWYFFIICSLVKPYVFFFFLKSIYCKDLSRSCLHFQTSLFMLETKYFKLAKFLNITTYWLSNMKYCLISTTNQIRILWRTKLTNLPISKYTQHTQKTKQVPGQRILCSYL